MSIKRVQINKGNNSNGKVILVGTPIGNINDVSLRVIQILKDADVICCEDTRNTSLLLKRLEILDKKLISCYSQNEIKVASKILEQVKRENLLLVYVSDAGVPGISDPGALLISKALELGIDVSSCIGPSAFLQALIVSNLDTSDFTFLGFLPTKSNVLKKTLLDLSSRKETLIFYEAPHRLLKTLQAINEVFPKRKCMLAREITKIYEEYIYGTVEELVNIDPSTIKGEYVIVLQGNTSNKEYDDILILNKSKELEKLGYSVNEISKILSIVLDIPKNYIYNLICEEYNENTR